jgi:hydroxymethylglutaryl-CoA lyase
MSDHVKIVEVGPRDGLQNEKSVLELHDKVTLVNALSNTGLSAIETGSFVSPKWVPQMANSGQVFSDINRNPAVSYSALIPNLKGYELAKAAKASEVAIFAAASEGFSQKNINCSISESIERFKDVAEQAKRDSVPLRGYLSCIFACPYDGATPISTVIEACKQLFELGCYEVSLGDTTGVGTAYETKALMQALKPHFDTARLALHFHDTYGQALANVYAGLEAGVRTFDASVAGLGGCPYAKGASGNLATEDLVYLLNGSGLEHGVDLDSLMSAGNEICAALGRKNLSAVAQAKAGAV